MRHVKPDWTDYHAVVEGIASRLLEDTVCGALFGRPCPDALLALPIHRGVRHGRRIDGQYTLLFNGSKPIRDE